MWSDKTSAFWQGQIKAQYGIKAALRPLDGEFDLNIGVWVDDNFTAVLKIMRPDCPVGLVEMQIKALEQIAKAQPELPVPRVLPRLDGALMASIADDAQVSRLLWMVSAMPGMTLGAMRPHSLALITQIGTALGSIAKALKKFDHPQLSRDFKWHPLHPHWAFDAVDSLENDKLKSVISTYFHIFTDKCEPVLSRLSPTAIHGDGNDYNILVTPSQDGPQLTGIIDFGDMTLAPAVCDLATAAAYLVLSQERPIACLTALVNGYCSAMPLSPDEAELVFPLLMTRLSVSLVNSAAMKRQRPDDPYVTISEAPAIAFVETASHWNIGEIAMRMRLAAGHEITDAAPRIRSWIAANRTGFDHVMGVNLTDAPICSCAVGDTILPENPTSLRQDEAMRLVPQAIGSDDIFVGHYLEPRLVYTEDAFLTAANAVDGRRTMHLGVDLFAPAGRRVFAPLPGVVVAAVNRADYLDYGGVVILAHSTDAHDPFYTLYGHVDPASIANLTEGDVVAPGQAFAVLGDSSVNGGWQPHLHFQLAMRLPDIDAVPAHDWPGVADPDDLTLHAALYPNPADLLGIPPEKLLYSIQAAQDLHTARTERFGANLKLSYRHPLQLLRGWKNYLYDEYGRTHLDAYNNVPHVGHAHPRLNAIIENQIRLINTNTRYLHPAQMAFADALRWRLPEHLTHCYFLTSGSEANELALRLARAYTGARGMIVQDHGYHGHTTGTIDISPYKFNGPGGTGKPDWVEITKIADPYRGSFGYDDPEAGEKYAADIDRAIAQLQARGQGLSGFIAESFPSVGGQIEPPSGYLAGVYARIRAAGGLCIADEVQTGLGRLGDAYWGFETQQASPDMVVLGKPVGNGHPIGVVITTAKIAAAFANGMEFFSTFGGTTLACRIGAEVLQIVDDEGLQDNALAMGTKLLDGFRDLAHRYPVIGDVRGRGLFLGIELVHDKETQQPASDLAAYVSNRLRENRILIGTDGPFDNVLKIRPPLTISADDCDLILAKLDKILFEAQLLNQSK